jgi:hypothetical protein
MFYLPVIGYLTVAKRGNILTVLTDLKYYM